MWRQARKDGAVSSSASRQRCHLLGAESGGRAGRIEKAAPGKAPARPGPFGVVPSRTPQCIKCAADVKRPWSRGATCAGLLPSQAGGGHLSKAGGDEKLRGAGLDNSILVQLFELSA